MVKEITKEEIEVALRKAKNKKATGPDLVAYEHLKDTKEEML